MTLRAATVGVVNTIVSFETLFVLFLFAGRIKADDRFAAIPVDLTALLFTLSVIAGFVVLLRRRARILSWGAGASLLMLALVTWLGLSLIWSPSRVYGPTKVFYFATLVLWVFVAPALLIGPSERRTRRLLGALVLFGVWTAAETTRVILSGGLGGFINTFGADYITLANTLSVTMVVVFSWLLFAPGRQIVARLAAVALMIWLGVLLMAGGGRGPVVALAVTMVFVSGLVLFTRWGPRVARWPVRRRVVLAIGALVVMFGVLASRGLTSDLMTISRFAIWRSGSGGGASVTDRLAFYRDGVTLWAESPVLGAGAGGYAVSQGTDMRLYPHNLFVEVLAEGGLVGGMLLAALFGSVTMLVLRRGRLEDPVFVSALSLALMTLVAAQFSGDLSDNRPVFMAIGLVVGILSTPRLQVQPPARPA